MRSVLALSLFAALTFAAPAQAQAKKAPVKAAPVKAAPAKASAAAPAVSMAVTPGSTMDNQISVWGILGYGFGYDLGYGLGARYQKIVVPANKSFLKLTNGIRDEIGIEGGVDFAHYSYDYGFLGDSYGWSYNEFSIVVGGVWNFWLNEKLAVYPKIDLGFGFGSVSVDIPGVDSSDLNTDEGGLIFQGAVGAVYKLDRLNLRAELGNHYLRLGAGFAF